MQNTFGIKDFILYVLVGVAVLMIWLSMKQDDRRFEQMQKVVAKLDEQAQTLARIQRELDDMAHEGVSLGPSARPAMGTATGSATRTGADSWARPGIPVEHPPEQRDPSPPENQPGFREGGEFIEVFEAQPKKMTPYMYQDVYGRRVIEGLVCETLGSLDPVRLTLNQGLAEAWQYDPKGEWLRVKIHDRARFSDGVPVTAEDVKFSFDWVMDPRMDTERFRSTINMIDSVEVISDKVCEFHFKEPQALNKIHALTGVTVIPEHFYSQFTPEQFNQSTGLLLGSGPYKLDVMDPSNQWTPGNDLVLVRNENYWRRKPPIARQRFTVITDNVARLTNYENGTGTMMRASPEQFRTKSEDPEFTAKNHTLQWTNMRSGFGFMAWNCGPRNGKLTPFHDRRVRLAMTSLLDRERILRDFYYGYGKIATSPFPPGSPMNDPTVKPWPYDLDKARELLKEAGWIDRDGDGILENEKGEKFEFEYTRAQGGTVSPKIAKYLKDQCAKVGIRMTERVVDWSIYADILDNRDFDAITMMWSQSLPESDPYQLWHSASIKNRGDNFVQYSNPEVDKLIEEGRRELDDDKRMEIWHKLHRVLHEDQPYTFDVNAPWFRFVRKTVSNVHPYPIGLDKAEMYFAMPSY